MAPPHVYAVRHGKPLTLEVAMDVRLHLPLEQVTRLERAKKDAGTQGNYEG